MKSMGGNSVRHMPQPLAEDILFADDAYVYSYAVLKKNDQRSFAELKSLCIYLLRGSLKCSDQVLQNVGDAMQIENTEIAIQALSECHFLVAGSRQSHATEASVRFFSKKDLKKVEKPWGSEVWITGEHPGYCLKEIFIKKGTRTSLQYHQMKRETNVLFDGTARLHFKNKDSVPNDQVASADLSSCELVPVSVVDVQPLTLHRLEAVSDILLYEVSTPHLDDVIRISDDTNRAHGRIQSEHGQGS